MVLIDTNIFIYFLKNEKIAVDYFNQLSESKEIIYYSFITRMELLGFPELTNEEAVIINNMLSQFNLIMFDQIIEESAILLKREIRLKIPDAIIAASAISYKCNLITRDISDFNKIMGLTLFNPYNN